MKKKEPNQLTKDAIEEVNKMIEDGTSESVTVEELFDGLV